MRLVLNEKLCNHCGKCVDVCPQKGIRFLGGLVNFCRQCGDCIEVCKRGAIQMIDGVVVIDKNKCNGCGACIRTCSYRAIYRDEKGKATKCDVCYPELVPKCVSLCPALSLKIDEKSEKFEKALGWFFESYSSDVSFRVLERGKDYVIFLDKREEPCYFYDGLSIPTEEEMAVVLDIINLYKEYVREDLLQLPLLQREKARLKIREQVNTILNDYLDKYKINLVPQTISNVLEIITASVGGNLGPLDFLIYNDDFEEITFNGLESFIEVKHRTYGRLKTNFYFTDFEFVKENVINKIAEFVGKPNVSERNPILSASLPNNDRLHAVMRPVVNDIAFTIRHFNSSPFTILDLLDGDFLDFRSAAYLWFAMELGKTIFIVGATATGKTTFLNSLLPFIPPDRRILCLEEVREISAPHRDFLVHKTSQSIKMQDLIYSALRETPDRVIIGEVRTPGDISAFLELAQAGPGEGSYATFHGETLETALLRLNHHGIAGVDLPGAVHMLVLLKRKKEYDNRIAKSTDKRYVAEIAEVQKEFKQGLPLLKKIFRYDYEKNGLVKSNSSEIELEFTISHYGGNSKRFTAELRRRMKFLKNCLREDLDYSEFVKKTRDFYRDRAESCWFPPNSRDSAHANSNR